LGRRPSSARLDSILAVQRNRTAVRLPRGIKTGSGRFPTLAYFLSSPFLSEPHGGGRPWRPATLPVGAGDGRRRWIQSSRPGAVLSLPSLISFLPFIFLCEHTKTVVAAGVAWPAAARGRSPPPWLESGAPPATSCRGRATPSCYSFFSPPCPLLFAQRIWR
jgi:hypothetical protein